MALKRTSSEEIKGRLWTDKELRVLRREAELQAVGDDSQIDFDDIPVLTEDQLARMVRLSSVGPKRAIASLDRSHLTS